MEKKKRQKKQITFINIEPQISDEERRIREERAMQAIINLVNGLYGPPKT